MRPRISRGEALRRGIEIYCLLEEETWRNLEVITVLVELEKRGDLKWFQILYLERNWLLGKEGRQVALVQDNATQRYRRFQREHPGLEGRLAHYPIASHLGITPTQLSRIRRNLGKKDGAPST